MGRAAQFRHALGTVQTNSQTDLHSFGSHLQALRQPLERVLGWQRMLDILQGQTETKGRPLPGKTLFWEIFEGGTTAAA